jgi:hypothetical protein
VPVFLACCKYMHVKMKHTLTCEFDLQSLHLTLPRCFYQLDMPIPSSLNAQLKMKPTEILHHLPFSHLAMIQVYSAIDTRISARSIEMLHKNFHPTHQIYPPNSPTSLTTPSTISNPTRQLRNAHLSHLSGTLRSRRRLSEAKPRFQVIVL